MQPRRRKIIDFLDWYERQLRKLQETVLCNTLLEAEEIRALGADEIIVATDSQPDGQGFQRFFPERDAPAGIERGDVWSAEEVMKRDARLGKRMIVLDERASRKVAAPLHLAEAGHEVIVVTTRGLSDVRNGTRECARLITGAASGASGQIGVQWLRR